MLDINLFRTDKGGDPVRAPRRLPGRRARHRRAIAKWRPHARRFTR
jgi:hypothetical protein